MLPTERGEDEREERKVAESWDEEEEGSVVSITQRQQPTKNNNNILLQIDTSFNFCELWESGRDSRERNDDHEDGFLVHVPSKHEGGEGTQHDALQERHNISATTPQRPHTRLK